MSAMHIGEARDPTASGADFGDPYWDRRAVVRWSFGAVITILAHGLIGGLMLRWQTVADVEPTATIIVELAPLITAPEVQESSMPAVPAQIQGERSPDKVIEKDLEEEPEAIKETSVPRPEMVEPRLEPKPELAARQPREARQEADIQHVEPQTKIAPIVVVEAKSDAELAPPPKQADGKEVDTPRSNSAETRPHEQTAQRQPGKPVPSKRRKQAPDRAPSTPQIPQAREPATYQAPAASTPSNSNALPSWKSEIMGILERNKHYPPEAEARHEHGVSGLAFSLNRQGHVTSARISRSSGFAALDAETLSLVRRVQPFPPPPKEVPGPQIALDVDIRYR